MTDIMKIRYFSPVHIMEEGTLEYIDENGNKIKGRS